MSYLTEESFERQTRRARFYPAAQVLPSAPPGVNPLLATTLTEDEVNIIKETMSKAMPGYQKTMGISPTFMT